MSVPFEELAARNRESKSIQSGDQIDDELRRVRELLSPLYSEASESGVAIAQVHAILALVEAVRTLTERLADQ